MVIGGLYEYIWGGYFLDIFGHMVYLGHLGYMGGIYPIIPAHMGYSWVHPCPCPIPSPLDTSISVGHSGNSSIELSGQYI